MSAILARMGAVVAYSCAAARGCAQTVCERVTQGVAYRSLEPTGGERSLTDRVKAVCCQDRSYLESEDNREKIRKIFKECITECIRDGEVRGLKAFVNLNTMIDFVAKSSRGRGSEDPVRSAVSKMYKDLLKGAPLGRATV